MAKEEPKTKSFKDIISAKKAQPTKEKPKAKAAKAEPKTKVEAKAAPTKEEPAVETAAELEVADVHEDTVAEFETTESGEETAQAANATSEENPAQPEDSVSKLSKLVEEQGKQIANLTNALEHERTRRAQPAPQGSEEAVATPAPADPASLVFSDNPHMDKVHEDAIRSKNADYDQVVSDLKSHIIEKNPQLWEQMMALPATVRFSQLYEMGVMHGMQKKYNTLDLRKIEAQAFAAGKKEAKEEFTRQQALKKKQAAERAILSQPTDISHVSTTGNDTAVDEYRSPASFNQVLRRVHGTA